MNAAIFLFAAVLLAGELEATDILLAMDAERQRLNSGSFVASGTYTNESDAAGVLEAPIEFTCDFDFAEGLVRIERREPYRRTRNKEPTRSDNWEIAYSGGQFARCKDFIISIPSGSDVAAIRSPTRRARSWENPFDVRTLGITFLWDFEKGLPYPEMWQNYQSANKGHPEIVSVDKGIYQLRWVATNQGTTWTIVHDVWVDSNRGYWPVRLEVNDGASGKALRPRIESTTVPSRVADVWVPGHFQIRDQGTKYELSFQWSNVNRTISSDRFEIDSFDLSGVRRVVDFRGAKPVVLRHLDEDLTKNSRDRVFGIWLIALGAAIVVGLFALRRLRRQSSHTRN
jgi:hypothetical protein